MKSEDYQTVSKYQIFCHYHFKKSDCRLKERSMKLSVESSFWGDQDRREITIREDCIFNNYMHE